MLKIGRSTIVPRKKKMKKVNSNVEKSRFFFLGERAWGGGEGVVVKSNIYVDKKCMT